MSGSRFAWELLPVIGADLGKRVPLKAGYRVLGMNYQTGNPENLFKYDVITQGIRLRMAVPF